MNTLSTVQNGTVGISISLFLLLFHVCYIVCGIRY
jgi:hypothetical protein